MPETFSEILDRRKNSATALFHRFRLEVASGLQFALFVEGFEDKAFYSRFLPIGNFGRDSIRLAHGKRNMDELAAMYMAERLFDRCDAKFVRDADFDDYLGTLPRLDKILCIDRYSVENFIFLPDNYRRLIEDRFGVDTNEYNLDECVDRYRTGVTSIFVHLAPFLGAAIAAMRDNINLNLDGLDIRRMSSTFFRTGKLRPICDRDYSRCCIPDAYVNDDTLAIGLEFVERDAFLWMRGHYIALVCSAYVQCSHDRICAMKAAGELQTLNPNLSSDFSASALAERMGIFCDPPAFLETLAA